MSISSSGVCPAASRQESWEDSDLFKPQPSSDVDALGKKRFVGKQRRGPENISTLD